MKATMSKRSGCLVAMAVGVMLATAGDSTWAQGVESSSWNSQYGDNQGSFRVDAQLQLQGQSGA